MNLSFWHIILLVLVVVLVFGAGKIPRLMKDMGQGINAFKKGLKENEGGDPPPGGDAKAAAAAQPAQIPAPAAQPAPKAEEPKKV
jgi:sec-independent protein translocase protein TatA